MATAPQRPLGDTPRRHLVDALPSTAQQGVDGEPFDLVLETGWLLVVVLVPLWVNLWANQPFELSKALLMRSLVWLLAGVWLAEMVAYRGVRWAPVRRHPLGAPILGMAVALLLTTLLAVDRPLSTFGSYPRAQGALTLASYPLLFLIISTRLRTLDQARRLMVGAIVPSAVIAPLGILQAAGLDPLGLVSDARAPVYATLGRSNFSGAYLAMLFPMALALFAIASGRRRGAALAALGMGQMAVVALTLARGAWLAAATGTAVFAALWFWPRLTRRGRVAVAGTGALIALAVLVMGGHALLTAQAGSVAARRAIWSAAWHLIRQRPWFGHGPDALELVFPSVYPPQLVYYHGRGHFVDRAHNLLLDRLVTQGIVGTLAWAWFMARFYAIAGRRALCAAPSGGRRSIVVGCVAAVTANLVGNAISFDVTPTATLSWVLMAVAASPALGQLGTDPVPPADPVGRPSRRRLAAGSLLMLAAAVAVGQLNLRPMLADVAHRTAVRQSAAGDVGRAVASARRAASWWPVEPEHRALAGRLVWHQAVLTGDIGLLAQAEAALLAALDIRPQDYGRWAELGGFYGGAATWDANVWPLAHDAYRRAVALAPHYARLFVAWGEVSLAQGQPEDALVRLYRAVDLDATDGLAYRLIGDVELALGRPEIALAAYQEAVRWSPDDPLAHLGLARTYAALGWPEASAAALAQAVAVAPEHPAVLAVQERLGGAPGSRTR